MKPTLMDAAIGEWRLRQSLSNLDLIYTLPHELAHFIVGRFLGVAVILDIKERGVLVPKDIPVWKHLLILIAPTILGIILIGDFLSGPFFYGFKRSTAQIALWSSTYGIIILASCIGTDWRDLVRYFKTGEIA